MEEVNQSLVAGILKERPFDAHKGLCGHVLIVAGSKGMAGAAVLAAMGALRTGAGLVKVSIEEELFPIIQSALPEAICINRELAPHDMEKYDAIAIGPGLGSELKGREAVQKVLQTKKPVIIVDADGLAFLKTLRKSREKWGGTEAVQSGMMQMTRKLIITPHPGEAAKLLDSTAKEINGQRGASGLSLTEAYGAISVLKGAGTIVTDLSGKQYVNTSGNPGLATAGSGDILTGIIAGLAAQGYTPLEAALAGVYIHGAAGDMGAEIIGEHGLIASDVGTMTALVIKKILKEKSEEAEEVKSKISEKKEKNEDE